MICLLRVALRLLLLGSASVLFLFWKQVKKSLKRGKYRLPPGPPSLPLLGSTPFMIGNPREVFNKLRQQYGDIYTVSIGSRPIVVLNGFDLIKECFVRKGSQFDSRPNLFWTNDLIRGKGLVSTSGPLWKEQRAFTIKVLRELGMGKEATENCIVEELQHLLHKLQSTQSEDWEISQTLNIAVANIISSFLFLRRYEYTDSALADVVKRIAQVSSYIGHTGILNVFPWLRNLPGDPMKYWKMVSLARVSSKKFYLPMVEEHKRTFNPDHIRDYVDAYLLEMYKRKDVEGNTFTEDQLVSICKEIVGAGTETTAWTLHWALAIFLNYPEIQINIQQELDMTDNDQPIYYRERRHYPYTDAFIDELQRFADLVSFGLAHATSCDVSIRGYYLPKGTMVLSNFSSVHTDPVLWPEPQRFDPSRFIGKDGERLQKEQLLSYSIGCRQCPGETMAKMELFMFISGLLQNFSFEPPSSGKIPDLTGIFDIVHHVEKFELRCVPRQKNSKV